jgi:hypothetical protein
MGRMSPVPFVAISISYRLATAAVIKIAVICWIGPGLAEILDRVK